MDLNAQNVAAIVAAGLVPQADTLDAESLLDAAHDALRNEAPEVKGWTAEQDKGSYNVILRGVPGAYFLQAQEYDDIGPFDTVEQAENAAWVAFGEFLTS